MSETDQDLSAFGIDRSRVLVGHVEFLPSERQVFVEGLRLHLTAREFDVLHVLAICAGHVVSRERIYEHVWGRPMPHSRDRAVHVHIRRIRVRLAEVSPDWLYVHTHFGQGYRFEPERADERTQGVPR